jgi:hypothetical protein
MMHVQLARFSGTTTKLAGFVIPLAGEVLLIGPVWTVIVKSSTFPIGVVLIYPVKMKPLTIAAFTTEVMF